MSYTIIDRRLNPGGKNIGNRQRFLKRAKEQLRRGVKDSLQNRSISSKEDQNIRVPVTNGTKEPRFHHDPRTGSSDRVLPGNKDFNPGDLIPKPQDGKGGAGKDGSDSGDGFDTFDFPITKDEFTDILFEDLELPNLRKTSLKQSVSFTRTRAGYVTDGTPSNLDLLQSMRNSIGRRIALKVPKIEKIKELEEEMAHLHSLDLLTIDEEERIVAILNEIEELRRRANSVPFLDPIDLRYRNNEMVPNPKHKAVMFCVMDISASMGEKEKDLAKRFYMLLYLFLEYKYDIIDIVFIRHHTQAVECTEDEFFHSKETGGTVVSSGFEEMMKIQGERYPDDEWNIYVAQASDGDNYTQDNPKLKELLKTKVLPISQYFAYIEVREIHDLAAAMTWYGSSMGGPTGIWKLYEGLAAEHTHMEIRKVNDQKQVYSVFRELFEKDKVI